MPTSTSESGLSLFDAQDLIDDLEMDLATVFHICGLNPNDMSTTSIDTIISAIQNTFQYNSGTTPDGEPQVRIASDFFLKKKSTHLCKMARRFHRWLTIARFVA